MFSAWAAHKCWTIEPMRRREREFERLQRAECSLPLAESANDKLVLRFFDGCSEEWSIVLITLQSQRVHLLGKLNVFFFQPSTGSKRDKPIRWVKLTKKIFVFVPTMG